MAVLPIAYGPTPGLDGLTAGTGLTVNGSALDNDLVTGKSGGDTVTGGRATGETLTLKANTVDPITGVLGKDNLIVGGAIGARGATFTPAVGGTYLTNDLAGSAGLACYNPTSGLAGLLVTASSFTITNGGTNYGSISTVAYTLVNSQNFVFGTAAGTKIGTATTQKIGFWNVTPVVQPATAGTATGFTAGAGTPVTDASTFTGGTGATAYRISDIVLALKQMGIMAA